MQSDEKKTITKRCACSAAYTLDQLLGLPLRYTQVWPWGERHEAGQCRCGSHIIVAFNEDGEVLLDPSVTVSAVAQ
jgi:hypothetical protein